MSCLEYNNINVKKASMYEISLLKLMENRKDY